MTHVTCRLTAKDRDQLRNPTLGSRVWATFYLFTLRYCIVKVQYIEAVYYLPASDVGEVNQRPVAIDDSATRTQLNDRLQLTVADAAVDATDQ